MRYASLAALVLALLPLGARGQERDGRVTPGSYVELDKEGEPRPDFTIKIKEVTANVVEVRGSNGWVAFAAYDADKGEYRGFFEWQQFGDKRSPGGMWADLYQVRLTRVDESRIRMDGKSKDNEFTLRWKVKP